MSQVTNAVTSSNTSSGTPAAAPAVKNALGSESTFLTLLVSQLKNQDPLSPADTNQFVSQLTSYSQLEQLININKNTMPPDAGAATPTTGK